MKTKILNLINDYKERKRLRKVYPEATDFVPIKEVFPKLHFDKNKSGSKLIPVIKDDDGRGYKKIYEEKEFNETLETGFLPITYHSAYTRGIAYGVVKRAFKKYPEFFKVFLDRYDKVVIDDAANDDNVLVIDDYTENLTDEGYTLEMLVSAVLKDYELSKEDISDIVSRVQEFSHGYNLNDPSLFTGFFFDRQVSPRSLRIYYARHGKFAELKQLLERKDNINGIVVDFMENEAITFLNTIFERNYFPTLISDNPMITRDAIKYMREVTKDEDSQVDDISSIEIDRIDSINTTRRLIKDIDPSGNLSKHFEDILKDGKLLTFKRDAKTGFPFEFFRTNDTGEIEVFDDREMDDDNSFFAIDFSETMTDVFELVNSIMLSYIEKNKMVEVDESGFNNMFKAFYETKVKDWLINIGQYDSEEINRLLNIRRANGIFEKDLTTTEIIADAMTRKILNNNLELSNLSDNDDVIVQRQQAMDVMSKVIRSQGKLDTEGASLAIGSYLGEQYPSDEFARHMMRSLLSYNHGCREDSVVLGGLMESTTDDGGNEIYSYEHWKNEKEDDPESEVEAVKTGDEKIKESKPKQYTKIDNN